MGQGPGRQDRRAPTDPAIPQTPPLLQIQETECGAVALGIVLAHHGAWVPLPELRQRCQVTAHGTNAMLLVRAAKSYGLTVRALRIGVDELRHLPPLAVLFWENHHFLVLEGIRGDLVWVNDPATGRRQISLEALKAGYSGVALAMQPGDDFVPRGTPPDRVRSMFAAIRPGGWWLLALAFVVLLDSVVFPISIHLLGGLVDGVIDGEALAWLPFLMVVLLAVLARCAHVLVVDRALGSITKPMIAAYLDDLRAVPQSFLALRQPAELAGRLRLVELPGTAVSHIMASGVRFAGGLVTWSIVLALIGWQMAAVFVIAIVLSIALRLGQQEGDARTQQRSNRTDMRQAGHELDIWRQRKRIKANGEELSTLARAVTTSADDENVEARDVGGGVIRSHVLTAVAVMVMVAPVVVIGVMAANGSATIGDVMVTLLAAWYSARLVTIPGSLTGFLASLPTTLAQLRDSSEERTFAERGRDVAEPAT